MKKFVAMLMCVCLIFTLVFALSGCGKKEEVHACSLCGAKPAEWFSDPEEPKIHAYLCGEHFRALVTGGYRYDTKTYQIIDVG